MKWYDEVIIKGMYCDGCGNSPEKRIISNLLGILFTLWCLGNCKGAACIAALQFLTAFNTLVFVRQLIIYHRRGGT